MAMMVMMMMAIVTEMRGLTRNESPCHPHREDVCQASKRKTRQKSPKGEKRLECPFLQPATPQVLIHQITKYMFVLMFLGLLEVVKLGQGVIST